MATVPQSSVAGTEALSFRPLDPRARGVCAGLLLAIVVIYGQTLLHPFLFYDDTGYVYANSHVTPGLTGAGIWWAFTDGPYGEWYPLVMLSHMLDCQVFGLNAWGHHLTNLLLHAAASIALFLVWWRMTSEFWPSAFVAALFAVHPQHVESVAWVAERRDVMSGLFFMLALSAYLGYVRGGRPVGRYCLVAGLFALALMSKPTVVTLPPLLVLLDFWPLARYGSAIDSPGWTRSVKRPGLAWLLLEKLPLLALAAAVSLITWSTHRTRPSALGWPERIGNAVVSCVTYVEQFFYPVDLAVFYPNPVGGPPIWKVAGAVAILGAVSAAAVIWRRRSPYLFVGWFWYLGMLTPVLGLVKIADHAMADRYMYLPGIGLSIALAWGTARMAAGSLAGRRALGACAGLVIAVLVAIATRQTTFWRDDQTLWAHAFECTTDNGKAELSIAEALARQNRMDEAIEHYRRAEKLLSSVDAYYGLGMALAMTGRFDEALEKFRKVVEIAPEWPRGYEAVGMTLADLGRGDEAEQSFRDAAKLGPLRAASHNTLASILLTRGELSEAALEIQEALKIEPENKDALRNLRILRSK